MDHVIISIRDLANLLLTHSAGEKEWITKNADYIINMCKRVSSNTPFTIRFVFDPSTSEDSLLKFVKCWGDLLETIRAKHSGFNLSWERQVKTSGILFWKTESVEFVLTVTWDGAV